MSETKIGEFIEIGVVAELNGKYWGCPYEDGQSTQMGFGSIENAKISDPKYCRKPTDMTWDPKNCPNPDYNDLLKAKLLMVRFTKTFELISPVS